MRLRSHSMAAQHPGIQLLFSNIFPLAGQLGTLQHHGFAMNAGHELGHAVPAVSAVVRMVGVIAPARLSAAAFKATGDDAIRLAAGDFRRGHGNALQTTATLYINSKGGHRNIHSCLQGH